MGNVCMGAKNTKKKSNQANKCKKTYKCHEIKMHDKTSSTENNNLIPVDLSDDEICITDPGNSAKLLNMLTHPEKIYDSYILSFNFHIKDPYLPIILNWVKDFDVEEMFLHESSPHEIHTIINQKTGITIYQGSEYNVPSDPYEYITDDPTHKIEKPSVKSRKLWLKCYNQDGNNFWPDCDFIPLGEHNIDKIIKLQLRISNMGIIAHMNDQQNTSKILTKTSGKNNTGFIFNSLLPNVSDTDEIAVVVSEEHSDKSEEQEAIISDAQGVGTTTNTEIDKNLPLIDIPDDSIELVSMKLFHA